MRLRRLFPEPGDVTVDEAIAGLRLGERAPPQRPYVALNMIATVDGRAAVGGGTRSLTGDADRAVMAHLRTQADVVMIGAGTLRAESYGRRLVGDPALRDKRRAEGLEPDPLVCLVSGRLDLPADLGLLSEAGARVLVATASAGTLGTRPANVEYLRVGAAETRDTGAAPAPGDAPLDLRAVLAALRADHGARSLLCEGGPRLNAGLLALGLVDELFLTLTARVAGGAGPTIVDGGGFEGLVALRLEGVLEADGDLFLRYRRVPSGLL